MVKLCLAVVLCSLPPMARAEDEEARKAKLSPDKKWEYRLVGSEPRIVNARTGETALDFETGTSLASESGQVVWAPDSRRLAFNYRAGARYFTCVVYELVNREWKVLPSLEEKATEVTKMMERAEQRDLKRLGVSKTAHRRRIRDEWKVRLWIDPDTFEAMAFTQGSVVVKKENEDVDYIGGGVLFTVKCDNKGGWKIIRRRELSDAALEKMAKEEEAKD